ncbi:cyclin-like protein [Rhizopogon salebrosus TDB-379]|nr:cyclin-like protein [Rhizopogon salebrosus TDB-379]
MATDFWASSHYKRWIVDRATLRQARADDLQYVDDPEYLDFFSIFFTNVITKLGKKLSFRQRVIATAIVFFRRFYIKNLYCETDPFIVIAACCYVAGKAEESPVHIKNMVAEARLFFSQQPYSIKYFPSDNSKLAEMEFYLVADLECDLTVFHPYRTLLSICKKESSNDLQTEAGEVGVGVDDGPRYWGSGEGQLELPDDAFQLAWSIINDTYRSDLCLLYPPHLLAITALYLTVILHGPTRDLIQQRSHPSDAQATQNSPRRSSRQSSTASLGAKKHSQDFVAFFAGLNVSLSLVATIAQEIISMYTFWDRYQEDPDHADSARSAFHGRASGASTSGVTTPVESASDAPKSSSVTPAFLLQILTKMRENRLLDITHSGRPVAVNKMLERTQAAG